MVQDKYIDVDNNVRQEKCKHSDEFEKDDMKNDAVFFTGSNATTLGTCHCKKL